MAKRGPKFKHPDDKHVRVTITLPGWIADWLDNFTGAKSRMIAEALKDQYELKKPEK